MKHPLKVVFSVWSWFSLTSTLINHQKFVLHPKSFIQMCTVMVQFVWISFKINGLLFTLLLPFSLPSSPFWQIPIPLVPPIQKLRNFSKQILKHIRRKYGAALRRHWKSRLIRYFIFEFHVCLVCNCFDVCLSNFILFLLTQRGKCVDNIHNFSCKYIKLQPELAESLYYCNSNHERISAWNVITATVEPVKIMTTGNTQSFRGWSQVYCFP